MNWQAHAAEWVTVALVIGALLFARRFGGGTALEQVELSNRVLERRVHELENENERLRSKIAILETKTDVSLAIGPVLEALKLHEERAAQRSEATLTVLDLIAQRLGPEAEEA